MRYHEAFIFFSSFKINDNLGRRSIHSRWWRRRRRWRRSWSALFLSGRFGRRHSVAKRRRSCSGGVCRSRCWCSRLARHLAHHQPTVSLGYRLFRKPFRKQYRGWWAGRYRLGRRRRLFRPRRRNATVSSAVAADAAITHTLKNK